jgi:hypothetical protein
MLGWGGCQGLSYFVFIHFVVVILSRRPCICHQSRDRVGDKVARADVG